MQPVQHQMMGYDRTSTMFSPDGRLLQVEYAKKTVKQGTTAIGMVCKDGVLLLADKRIIEKLSIQLKAYPDELLGVVSPTNEALSRIWQHIASSDLSSLAMLQGAGEHVSFDLDKRICVCTFHAAKSLEFRALHIAGCESLKKFPLQRNMAFTAVTRAKTSLSIYYSEDIPGFFEKALNVLQPIPDLPELTDVFGGKG